MRQVEALARALDVQADLGDLVLPSQLRDASPCPGWSVGDVVGHSIGVTLKFAAFAAGVTAHPHPPEGDLVGPDHRASLRRAAVTAQTAWASASADLDRRCHLAFGSFAAEVAAGINLFDVLAHTWDIATATDLRLDCPDDLWEAGLDAARAVIGPGRDPRHYGPELPTSVTAPAQVRFLAYLGRAVPS